MINGKHIILAGFTLLMTVKAGERLQNPDFLQQPLTHWETVIRDDYPGPLNVHAEEKGVIRIEVAGTARGHLALLTQKVDLVPGKTYVLTAELKSPAGEKGVFINLNWKYAGGSFSDAGLQQFASLQSGQWETVTQTFVASAPREGMTHAQFNLNVGMLASDLWVRRLSLVQKD